MRTVAPALAVGLFDREKKKKKKKIENKKMNERENSCVCDIRRTRKSK